MWHLVLSTLKADISEMKALTGAHFVWMQAQHAQGTVLLSGPTPDRKMGIYVVKADSAETAAKIADGDPFHVNKVRTYQLIPWEVHQAFGIGPFSLPGIQWLAEHDPATHYTHLPPK